MKSNRSKNLLHLNIYKYMYNKAFYAPLLAWLCNDVIGVNLCLTSLSLSLSVTLHHHLDYKESDNIF